MSEPRAKEAAASEESQTLDWEKDPTQGVTALHLLFQGAHNLKSGLAMAGFPQAASSVHSVESLLDDLRRGRVPWSETFGETILGIIDELRAAIDDRVDRQIEAALAPQTRAPAETKANTGTRLYRIDKLFRKGLNREDFDSLPIFEDIASVGKLVSIHPSYEQYASGPEDGVISFTFETALEEAELLSVFYDPLILLSESQVKPPEELMTRILIVEDDSLLAAMLAKFLQQQGQCRVAVDGQQALDLFQDALLKQTPYHLVILDLGIPRITGDQVLKQLRRFEESHGIFGLDRCVVVINTVIADTDRVFSSFRYQADGYFVKPLSFQGITQSMASVQGKLRLFVKRLKAREFGP